MVDTPAPEPTITNRPTNLTFDLINSHGDGSAKRPDAFEIFLSLMVLCWDNNCSSIAAIELVFAVGQAHIQRFNSSFFGSLLILRLYKTVSDVQVYFVAETVLLSQ